MKSFKSKVDKIQDVYAREQARLKEQARLERRQKEWKEWDTAITENANKVIAEDDIHKIDEYLQWCEEQKLIKEQQELAPVQEISPGVGIGHISTWVLTWKSFSTHPDIIKLSMSEKIRLYKIAERQQIDKLNYYTNIYSNQWRGTAAPIKASPWGDGSIDAGDGLDVIENDLIIPQSVDINTEIEIKSNVTVTVKGILTTNAIVKNKGIIKVKGLLIENEKIKNLENGKVIIE